MRLTPLFWDYIINHAQIIVAFDLFEIFIRVIISQIPGPWTKVLCKSIPNADANRLSLKTNYKVVGLCTNMVHSPVSYTIGLDALIRRLTGMKLPTEMLWRMPKHSIGICTYLRIKTKEINKQTYQVKNT